jgi:hypothetical protein
MSPSQQAFGPAVDLGALTQTLRFKREELQTASEAHGRRQAESYGTEACRECIDAYLPDHYKSA